MILLNYQDIAFLGPIIGGITGVGALLFNLYKHFSEKPKLKFEDTHYYLNGFYMGFNSGNNSTCQLVINLRIHNLSISPVSIGSVFVQYSDIFLKPSDNQRPGCLRFSNKAGGSTEYGMDSSMMIPTMLSPKEIFDVTLFFPNADRLYEAYKALDVEFMPISISFTTSRKRLKFETHIFELSPDTILKCQEQNKNKFCRM